MKIKKSVTPEYPGWIIELSPTADKLTTYLYTNSQIAYEVINRLISFAIKFAKIFGCYSYVIVDDVHDFNGNPVPKTYKKEAYYAHWRSLE